MGMLRGITTDSGIPITNAYHRINSFNGGKNKLNFGVSVYINRDSFIDGKEAIDYYVYSCEIDISDSAPNYTRQAYLYLKSLDEYKDAKNVFEDGQQL